jgi:WD40 repeat protein
MIERAIMNDSATQRTSPTTSYAPQSKALLPQVTDHDLIRCIGSGSYGEVWLARSVIGTYRAIKVVYRQNFENERPYDREFSGMKKFEPISRSHEGLVDILQVGRNDQEGYFYYIMELGDDQVSGQQIVSETYNPKTLGKEVANRGKLPFEECLKVSLSLTSALAHLHKHGLIHRDIKPSNIIFVNGIPKIADIGLVSELGTSRSFVGTEGFIPPEGPGSPEGDIFSLGKVLYEISTGKDRQKYPELPTELGENPDHKNLLELNEVILKACDGDVQKRYHSADQMHADLVLLQAGKSVKRLRMLERRVALLTRIGLGAAILMLIVAAAYYEVYRGRKQATQRLAWSYVTYGTRSVNEGDLFGSLPWFAEALHLDKGNTSREESHRIRLASVLRQCPKLVQMWFSDSQNNDAEFSPDGHHVVTAGADGSVTIWDEHRDKPILRITGHTGEVETASYNSDGSLIVSAGDDNTARIWASETGHEVKSISPLVHPDMVYCAKFNHRGDRIVTAGADSKVRIWDVSSGKLLITLTNHSKAVWHASFSPDDQHIVTASMDQTAQVSDAATGRPVGLPIKHKNWVYQASFSPDGRYVVTASFDRTAQVCDAETGVPVFPSLKHPEPVRSAEFSPDGRYVVTACWDYTARVWNPATGEEVSPPLKRSGNVTRASFSPEGRRIITLTTDGVVSVWDLSPNNWAPPSLHRFFSANGNRFALVNQNKVQVWDTLSNSIRSQFTNRNPVVEVNLNRDGSRLVALFNETLPSGDFARVAQLSDSTSGKALGQPFAYPDPMKKSVLSDNGSYLGTFGGKIAQIWDTINSKPLSSPLEHSNDVSGAVFSPDGSTIVTTSGTSAYLWDTITGRPIRVLSHKKGAEVHAAFSPDGRHLITSCTDRSLNGLEAQIWDVQTGQPIGLPLKHRDGVLHASFSPDGQLVVTASEDRTAQIWVVATGKRHGPPLWHKDEVREAYFSQDGRRIVTVCRDRTARVWDTETSEPLTPPLKHLEAVWHAGFLSDGHGIVTINDGAMSAIWELPYDRRSTEDLVLLAQLLSGHQSDQTSGPLPLTKEDLQEDWQKLRSEHPADFGITPNEILSWHEREADASEAEAQWFAARFHVNHLVAAKPGDESLKQRADRIQAKLIGTRTGAN